MLGKIYLGACFVIVVYSWSCVFAPEKEKANSTLFGERYEALSDGSENIEKHRVEIADAWEINTARFFHKVAQSHAQFHVVFGHGDSSGIPALMSYRRLSEKAVAAGKTLIVIACRSDGSGRTFRVQKGRTFKDRKYPNLLFIAPKGHILEMAVGDEYWLKMLLWKQKIPEKKNAPVGACGG